MLLSYDSRFALQVQPNHPSFNYLEHFHQIYRVFHRRQVLVDVVSPTDDLSGYKLVVAPTLHVVPEPVAENLKSYVQLGGMLVLTQRSGVKDEANAVVDRRLPGPLAELCGMEVEEYDSLADGMHNALEFVPAELNKVPPPEVGVLCDILKPTTAQVVAHYLRDFYAGQPAITHNRFGEGQVIYVGAVGDDNLYGPLMDWLMSLVGASPLMSVPPEAEVTERWAGNQRLRFVLNHAAVEQTITLDRAYENLLDGRTLIGELKLLPHEVWVLADI